MKQQPSSAQNHPHPHPLPEGEGTRGPLGLLTVLLLLGCASLAHAQTFSRLTQDTWNGTDLAETYDHPIIEADTHVNQPKPYSTDSGLGNQDSQIIWWDSYGQVRFNRNDQDSPFVGYRILTITTGTDDRLIKSTMDEFDGTIGLHLGTHDGWTLGTVLGAGYSSTHPFVNTTGIFGIGHATAEHPIDDKNSFLLSVDYEGNGGLLPDVPLPGFAFIHKGKELNALVGYPFSKVLYEPPGPFQFSAQYNVPYSAMADVEYRIVPHFGLYANAANFFQGFEIAGEDRTTDRQFEQMRRVEAGVRVIDQPLFDASIGIGYAFDQAFSDGYDVRDLRPIGHIGNAPYVAFVLRGTF